MSNIKKEHFELNFRRKSGIELCKVIAIFLIVVGHVCSSLSGEQLLNIKYPISNVNVFCVYFTQHFGSIGNSIFLVCSSWFLCDSKKLKTEKVFRIMIDVWLISIAFLLIYLFLGVKINSYFLITTLFPNLFATNWFVTCYLLLYIVHPGLVCISENIDQRTHAILCVLLFCAYFILAFLRWELLFANSLIVFISIFLFVSYMKKYMHEFHCNKKNNCILLALSVLGLIGLYSGLYYLSISIPALREVVFITCSNSNPFALFIAIALFNLFSQFNFYNRIINSISGVSLLIYILHENKFFRVFTREKIWMQIISKYGMEYLMVKAVIFSLILFFISYLLSLIYRAMFQKKIEKIARVIDKIFIKILNELTNRFMRIK